jgi:hypothetical protein
LFRFHAHLQVKDERRSLAVQLLYAVREDDEDARDAADSAAPLARVGISNLGNTCFLNATVLMLLYPLLWSLPARAPLGAGLGSCVLQAAVRVAVDLPCSHSMLRTQVCALPQGFGWQVGRLRDVITVQEDAHEFVLKLLDDSPALESALRLHLTSYVVCGTTRVRPASRTPTLSSKAASALLRTPPDRRRSGSLVDPPPRVSDG